MADNVPEAQRLMQQGGICTLAYRTPEDWPVICLQDADTCSLHSRRARLRAEVAPVIEVLRKYEDEHGSVQEGWICLGAALQVAEAALTDSTPPHGSAPNAIGQSAQ